MERRDLPAFLGRRAEIAQIRRLLGRSRLVTLTGLSGVGKSRLAEEAAWSVRKAFSGGVHVVDVSREAGPAALARTAVQAVGAGDGRLLLLLDGVERLAGPCAALAESLLRNAPGLRILATGRRSLGVVGEHLLPVGPLPPADAVALLAGRAPGRGIADVNRKAAARLCERLGRMPSAIELAARRLCAEPEPAIEDLLDDPFHETAARGALDRALELCSPDERHVWSRVAAFPGLFGLADAERVCADIPPPAELLDALIGLIDKSLLIREESGGEVRFRVPRAGAGRPPRGHNRDRPVPCPRRTSDMGGPPVLTRREHEVAELVADGLSNREVAEKLVISKRTAEAHMEHILAKLNFSSRTQVAAWVVRRRGDR
ncbi:LuxR C-terminal-related transcriptional regulator [Microtetraspora malaysiensis]|uniref:LuxR C-terminal-related transcriptional regulator n=1 Tax=Microtetraspora malaysiensis TaxID=161358 RepID=UPI000834A728|nr:LuxR C-terminal-related transcriptional regulator [Microtetraspora malaysiensis]